MTQAWLKTRNPREKQIFGDLFELSFIQSYTWATQNVKLMMEILQCNVISQMICILEGLIPTGKEENDKRDTLSHAGSIDGKSTHKVYV